MRKTFFILYLQVTSFKPVMVFKFLLYFGWLFEPWVFIGDTYNHIKVGPQIHDNSKSLSVGKVR